MNKMNMTVKIDLDQAISIIYLLSLDPYNFLYIANLVAHACPYCNFTSNPGDPIIKIDIIKNSFYCRECGNHRTATEYAMFMSYDEGDYHYIFKKMIEALEEKIDHKI